MVGGREQSPPPPTPLALHSLGRTPDGTSSACPAGPWRGTPLALVSPVDSFFQLTWPWFFPCARPCAKDTDVSIPLPPKEPPGPGRERQTPTLTVSVRPRAGTQSGAGGLPVGSGGEQGRPRLGTLNRAPRGERESSVRWKAPQRRAWQPRDTDLM